MSLRHRPDWREDAAMNPKILMPILVTALILWAVYRRMRRSFGRQAVNPLRMWFRVGLLTLIGALLQAEWHAASR
jgi:hypothetical protein